MSDFDCIPTQGNKTGPNRTNPQKLSQSEAVLVFSALVPKFRITRGSYRGPAFYRDGDNNTSLSISTEHGGKYYDFGTGAGGDVITFVQLVRDSNFLTACRVIEDIIGRPLLDNQHKLAKPTFRQAELARAELFQTGYSWWLQRYVTTLKKLWGIDEQGIPPDRIYQATQLFESVREWSTYTTVEFLRRFQSAHQKFVNQCIAEAQEAQRELARAITSAAKGIAA
jgi:hypothetical protein